MGKINKYCDICGKNYASETHHLIGGTSERRLSDKHHLTLDICNECHATIHNNNTANKLSKMLGQAMFEKDNTRYEYLKIFKKNYLPMGD